MALITLGNGKTFEAEAGDSLVDSAAKAGLTLPHSCKTGRCSTCRCKVIEGTTAAQQDELGLTDEEKEQGWQLACVRQAESDVCLDLEDLGDIEIPAVKTLPCRINAIEDVAPEVRKITLRLPPNHGLAVLPGQYINVIGSGGVRRSYSLANGFDGQGALELLIKRVQGGVLSNYWFDQAKPNDLLRLNGPHGTFFLRDVQGLSLVFLATGTGIAPVKAILERLGSMPADQQPERVLVFWGGRVPSDLFLDLSTSEIEFVPVLSRAPDSWSGQRGYVQDVALRHGLDWAQTVVYACGSNAMIQSATAALQAAGLPNNRFLSDAFVASSES